MSRIHANLLSKRFLGNPLRFELSQQGIQGHTVQVRPNIRELAYFLHLFELDGLQRARIIQERDGQGFAMVAIAMFPDIATTGRRDTLGVYLNRDGVRPVIADHLSGDVCAASFSRRERMDIGFGFLTGDERPTAFESSLKEIEIGIGQRDPLMCLGSCPQGPFGATWLGNYPSLSDLERRTASI